MILPSMILPVWVFAGHKSQNEAGKIIEGRIMWSGGSVQKIVADREMLKSFVRDKMVMAPSPPWALGFLWALNFEFLPQFISPARSKNPTCRFPVLPAVSTVGSPRRRNRARSGP